MRVLNVDTLRKENAFVDVGQTSGQEGAELDEVINRDSFFLQLSLTCGTPIHRLDVVVGAGNLHCLA